MSIKKQIFSRTYQVEPDDIPIPSGTDIELYYFRADCGQTGTQSTSLVTLKSSIVEWIESIDGDYNNLPYEIAGLVFLNAGWYRVKRKTGLGDSLSNKRLYINGMSVERVKRCN